jgi:SAM-dependent methyltransferase
MLVPQPEIALQGARRVLRDRGRIAYAVWGPPDRNPWLAMLAMAVVQNGHQPPGDAFAPAGVFSLADAASNTALLASAGFADVDVQELPGVFRYDSFDDYWNLQTAVAGPLAVFIESLTPDEVAAIRATLVSALAPFETGGRYEIPSLAIGAVANVP